MAREVTEYTMQLALRPCLLKYSEKKCCGKAKQNHAVQRF